MSQFHSTAAWYDVLANAPRRLEREGPLLLECLRRAPGNRVVDLACGTGIHALYLAEQGAEVTALDLSAPMIEHARAQRPHPRVRYGVADMREIAGGPWDLALCLGNSLSLLGTPHDLRRVCEGVAASLAPGGRFLIQILNYRSGKAAAARHRVEHASLGDTEITAVKSLVPQEDRTYLSLAFFVRAGEHVEAVAEPVVLRNWTQDVLGAAAEGAGLGVEALWGGFDKSPYDPPASGDLLMLFQG